MRSSVPTIASSRARSRPSSCALSGVFQMPGSSSSRLTSVSRSCLLSYSKKPPESFTALGEIVESTADLIDFHGTTDEMKRGAAMVTERWQAVTASSGGKKLSGADVVSLSLRMTSQVLHDQLQPLAFRCTDSHPAGTRAAPDCPARPAGASSWSKCRNAMASHGRPPSLQHVHLQMPLAQHTHTAHRECTVEQRLGKCLTPRTGCTQQMRDLERQLVGRQFAVRMNDASRLLVRHPARHFRIERDRRTPRGAQPAASAPQPSHDRRTSRSAPDGGSPPHPARHECAHSGTERAEPLSDAASARASAITGRWTRSLTREATRPTTP